MIGFMMFSSCNDNNDDELCIMGEGVPGSRTLNISGFNGIDLAISGNVTITQGATQEVIAIGHQNVIDDVITVVDNNQWVIRLEEDCYQDFELSFQITVPDIVSLGTIGSGNILVNNFSGQSGLDIGIFGSGDLTINEFEDLTFLSIGLSGSGNFTANEDIPTLETLFVFNRGSGDCFGFNLTGEECFADALGSGNVELTATNSLDVEIAGSGNVSYKGNPAISQNITGSGELINAN